MLDQLVESRSNSESNRKRGGFLFTTAVLVFSLFASGIMWSLFAKNLEMGGDGLEFSSLVAPVPVPETAPPPPEQVKQAKPENNDVKLDNSLRIRQVNMATVNEPFVPKVVSTTPNTSRARPSEPFSIGEVDRDPIGSPSGRKEGIENATSQPLTIKPKEIEKSDTEEPPPTMVAKKIEPKIEKPPTPRTVSLGVINGKAQSLPVPAYPPPARAVHASGEVNVQVTIDEQGNVISANAVSGHALLRQAAENAAKRAKFTPTYLSKVPVKVTGLIVYRFAAQ